MGEQGQGDMPIPARPGADFLRVQASLALGFLQTRLTPPPLARYAHAVCQRGLWRPPDPIIGTLAGRGQAPPEQDPRAPPAARPGLHVHLPPRPGRPPWPLTAFTRRARDPRLVWQEGCDSPHRLRLSGHPDGVRLGDRQHVGLLLRLQPSAECVRALDRRAHHPRRPHPRRTGACEHPLGQRPLGGKARRLRHPRRAAMHTVLRPLLGQIEVPIQEGCPLRAGMQEEDPDLAVRTAPRCAAVPLYCGAPPADFFPFLSKPVSSTTRMPAASPRCSSTYVRRSSRTTSASQSASESSRCTPCGPARPGPRPVASHSCVPPAPTTRSATGAPVRAPRRAESGAQCAPGPHRAPQRLGRAAGVRLHTGLRGDLLGSSAGLLCCCSSPQQSTPFTL
jgi:hypothetical protein